MNDKQGAHNRLSVLWDNNITNPYKKTITAITLFHHIPYNISKNHWLNHDRADEKLQLELSA
jgi:hypothetical protein